MFNVNNGNTRRRSQICSKFKVKTPDVNRRDSVALSILTGKKYRQMKLALTKSTDMNIWVVGTSNRLFVRGS